MSPVIARKRRQFSILRWVIQKHFSLTRGVIVVYWFAKSPYSKRGLILRSGPFCAEYLCSPCAHMGFLQVPRLPPIGKKHANYGVSLIDHSKRPVVMNMCVDGLCLYMSALR